MIIAGYLSAGLLALLIAYIIYYYVKWFSDIKSGAQPPGPVGFPFIGFLPFLKIRLHEQFAQLSKKYKNPVLRVHLGQRMIYVLNDGNTIRDALKLRTFSGRPDILSFNILREGGFGTMTMRTGDYSWKMIRKMAVRALSLFSTSKNSALEETTNRNVQNLKKLFRENSGKVIDARHALMNCALSTTCSLTFGRELDYDEPAIKTMATFFDDLVPNLLSMIHLDFLPALTCLSQKRVDATTKIVQGLTQFVTHELEKHEYDGTVRTIADGMKKSAQESDPEELGTFGITPEMICMTLTDLLAAGYITSAENTLWLLVIAAHYPDIQVRIHEEIDDVIGSRRPSIQDEDHMPFLQACIMEALRFASGTPLALAHSPLQDIEFRGYKIPAGSIVFPNLWGAHYNPEEFPDPHNFIPTRWLNEAGTRINPDVYSKLMAFSSGSRRCVGENLALQSLFITNCTILQEFNVSLDPEETGDPLESEPGIVLAPRIHNLIFTVRD